jgi:hypothetical protein
VIAHSTDVYLAIRLMEKLQIDLALSLENPKRSRVAPGRGKTLSVVLVVLSAPEPNVRKQETRYS